MYLHQTGTIPGENKSLPASSFCYFALFLGKAIYFYFRQFQSWIVNFHPVFILSIEGESWADRLVQEKPVYLYTDFKTEIVNYMKKFILKICSCGWHKGKEHYKSSWTTEELIT